MRSILIFMLLAIASGSRIYKQYKDGDRYIYFPDGDGVPHLVDLYQEPDANIKVDANRIKYYLYTRWNPLVKQEIFFNNAQSLENSHFDPRKNVKFIAHGWRATFEAGVNKLVTEANLRSSDVNVIVIDWSAYASSINYIDVARKTRDVGIAVAQFIDFLAVNGAPLGNFHLVGFSIGAHVIGNAARNTKMGRIRRLTALDPAGPLFGSYNYDRLRPSDSDYTEVIHTNDNFNGNRDLMGHVDFYPNGGSIQPGCSFIDPSCSHARAYQYYAETIENQDFLGQRCNSLNHAKNQRCSGPLEYPMGGAWNHKSGEGIFHIKTNAKSPFASKYT